jgi:hypothetical protein
MKRSLFGFLVCVLTALCLVTSVLASPNASFDRSVLEGLNGYSYDETSGDWEYMGVYGYGYTNLRVYVAIEIFGTDSVFSPYLWIRITDTSDNVIKHAAEIAILVDTMQYTYSNIDSIIEDQIILGETGKKLVEDLAKAKSVAIKITDTNQDTIAFTVKMDQFIDFAIVCKNILEYNIWDYCYKLNFGAENFYFPTVTETSP